MKIDPSNRQFWDNEARLKAIGKGMNSPFQMKKSCWKGFERVPGTKKGSKGSCKKI